MSQLSSSGAPRWHDFRSQMPVAERWAYFDHAAVAPLPAAGARAVADYAAQAAAEGDTVWPAWSRRVEQSRTLAARLLGADEAEVALVHSTSEGIGLVAEGYPWKAGDNLITLDNEFPSNQYPWLNLAARGVETRRIAPDNGRVDLKRIEAACDQRTRLIAISWVGYLTGWRVDLDAVVELAHRRGAHLLVDAIQGLGVFPLDVKRTPIDFLAADGHKWLLGPEGAGLFYLRREHLDLLRPIGLGWHSVQHASDYGRIELTLKNSAARYEGGTQNMVGFLGLAESLELLTNLGTEALSQRVLEIADFACERLERAGAVIYSPRDEAHRSGIVSFEWPGHAALDVKKHCLEHGVVLSARSGKLRISPHGYVNETDVERLIAALEKS